MEIVIVQFTEGGPDPDGPTQRLDAHTADGKRIVFWGSPEDGTRNIDALKHQKLPVMIDIDPEDCIPSKYQRQKYGTTWSVPEHAWVCINPEF